MSESEDISTTHKQKTAYTLSSFRVLVIDDYPFMADLMSSMLREFGVGHILQANSGNEAKEMLLLFNSEMDSRSTVDMVVVDWLMPDGDGLELLSWIRGHRKDTIKFLPAILCSAYASEKVVVASRDYGANEALAKPISADKLAHRILHVIDNPRPFIKSQDFFGPDRRRREKAFDGDEKRVLKPEEIKEVHERI